MPNTNKSHSELNTSLYFRDDRHRCQPVLCCLRADRFGESYAAHIDRDVAQTLRKVLNYSHRCHISLGHSNHSLLTKHRPNYYYLHELPYQFYSETPIVQTFSFHRLRHDFSLLFPPEVEFQLKMPIFSVK